MAGTAGDSKVFDSETKGIIYEGASISQLSKLFHHDNRKTAEKIYGLQPVGKRAGSPIYRVDEAARYLVAPILSIDEWIARMKHTDLPTELRKEFWAGMRSKQLYEIEERDLWRTEQVQDHLIEVLKIISMSLRLAPDKLDDEVGITPQQRQIVNRIIDEALANAHDSLMKAFEKKEVPVGGSTTGSVDDEL